MIRLAVRRRTWTIGLAIACVALTLAAGGGERLDAHPAMAAPAAAADPGGGSTNVYELVSAYSNKCLSVWPTLGLGAGAVQWTCVGQNNQHWRLEPTGTGSYYLRIGHSDQCLSVWPTHDLGAAAVQWSCVGQNNQEWTLEPAGDGWYYVRIGHSGQCLSVYPTHVDGRDGVQWTCVGQDNQRWWLRPASPGGEDLSTADIVRFLEQATWGPTPELIEHVRELGFEAFVEEQLSASMSSYPTLAPVPTTRDTATCPNNSVCQRDNYSMYPLQTRFFRNGLYGPDQLRQRVAFALHQIIVVSAADINLPFWMAPYLQTLDRHAFGTYRQLLYDITRNPAMGNYLDITGNSRLRFNASGARVAGPPNENYARELLQLFSLGTFKLNPDGTQKLDASGQPVPTYGQDQIDNFSRVFTGWARAALNPPVTGAVNYIDPMVVNAVNHDVGAKTLLNGVGLPANQSTDDDLNDALDNIMADPSTAPYISKLLIQHLVTSNPSPAYVGRVASAFGVTGDMTAAIRAILLDPEARGAVKPEAGYGRLRHPAQLILNILRAFDARSRDLTTESDGYLNPNSSTLGMNVFLPPSVFSYFSPSNGVPGGGGLRGPEFQLLSTSTAIQRANFMNQLAFSGINANPNNYPFWPSGTALNLAPFQALAADPPALVDALDTLLLHETMSSGMRTSIIGAVNAVAASNPLKRARTAVYLVTTSSQYQVQR